MNIVPQMHSTIIVDNPPKPRQLYQLGWNHYLDGVSRDTCDTDHERRGWDAANRAEAAAASGYDKHMGW